MINTAGEIYFIFLDAVLMKYTYIFLNAFSAEYC